MSYENLTPEQLYGVKEDEYNNFDWQGSDKPARIRYSTDEFAYNSKTDGLDFRTLTDEHALELHREHMYKYARSDTEDRPEYLDSFYDEDDTEQQKKFDQWLSVSAMTPADFTVQERITKDKMVIALRSSYTVNRRDDWYAHNKLVLTLLAMWQENSENVS